MGITVRRGDPKDNQPGKSIVIPEHPAQIRAVDIELDRVRRSYLRNALKTLPEGATITETDRAFLAADMKITLERTLQIIGELDASRR
jgi:hypothetical protein